MARHSRNKVPIQNKDRIKVKTVVLINSVCILALSVLFALHLMGAV